MLETFKRTDSYLRILELPLHILISIFIWPYRLFYYKNTRDPIQKIVSSRDKETTQNEVNRWLKLRLKEAQYVVTGVSPFLNSYPASINFRSQLV